MIQIRCHGCKRCLGEVSENSSGELSMKCHKCRHQNRYQMPDVNPDEPRVRQRAASMKKVVAPDQRLG